MSSTGLLQRALQAATKPLRQRLIAVRECWPKLRQRLIGQLLTAAELRDLLRAAGCPITPEEIELDRTRLKASDAQARQIRRGYTIFDFAAETGCLVRMRREFIRSRRLLE